MSALSIGAQFFLHSCTVLKCLSHPKSTRHLSPRFLHWLTEIRHHQHKRCNTAVCNNGLYIVSNLYSVKPLWARVIAYSVNVLPGSWDTSSFVGSAVAMALRTICALLSLLLRNDNCRSTRLVWGWKSCKWLSRILSLFPRFKSCMPTRRL